MNDKQPDLEERVNQPLYQLLAKNFVGHALFLLADKSSPLPKLPLSARTTVNNWYDEAFNGLSHRGPIIRTLELISGNSGVAAAIAVPVFAISYVAALGICTAISCD
ncbi:hypothetical protein HYY73_01535 [Candidatus Woesearchaeota archaeon]|nr:hypothetical protein [Candidatus Woesearchaeota archaeon]